MNQAKPKVLFLCTGNSCRSQMAEGWARAMWGDRIDAYSAGIETHGLNPNAVKVMAESGVDISGHRSKRVDDLLDVEFNLVVTVCGHAHETCPMFPARAKVIHVGFDDPPKLAESAETEEARLDCYRRVRDQIRAFVETLPGRLGSRDIQAGSSDGDLEGPRVPEIAKAEPAADYPPEEGCYLRGNDYSPVAVVVILRWEREKTPPEIEALVRVAVESGAALSGTLQTENIGLEKVVCNVVANPNIRYLIVCGPESPGHSVGDAILALAENGLDARKRIIAARAPTPYLFNVPAEAVERFRQQVTVIDLVNEGSPEVLRQAVWACYQEEPTGFRGYRLHDPGAFPAPPLSGKITWRVTNPEREPKDDQERAEATKFKELAARIRQAAERRRGLDEGKGAAG